ncbi:S4 RNA-binding protein, partial [Staphylococcus aureus]|uniref:S4 domain-containing protein n=1 Tax=Staphylococcus aureus TaxID=1280 RepID=UPI00065C0EC6
FIMLELQCIKGATVKLYTIPVTDMIQSNENWKNESATVSSLRVDVDIKETIRKSRTIAKKLIEKKRVKVNHTVVDSADFQLQA